MGTSNLIRPVFFPRGVASRDAAIGCTTHGGTIYGLQLQTGRLRWQTSAAQRPLLIHVDRLFAAEWPAGRGNVLRVRNLDLADPERNSGPSSDIVFSPWVDVTDGDTFTFDVYGAERELVLQWWARRRYRGGAPPPAAILHAMPQELAGTARVHFATGIVEMTYDGARAETSHPVRSLTTIPFRMGSWQREETWICKEYRCGLTMAEHMGKQWLILRRQAPDGHVRETELCAVDRDSIPRVTRDGAFVLAWTTQSDEQQWQGRSACVVFRADTGASVAKLAIDPDAEDPCILEPTLYCITAKTLIALDLDRGESAWSWPLPPVQFKGPPPLRK